MSGGRDALPRPMPPLPDDAHKGGAGRVLCLTGSPSMPGAAILATRAAMRAGAGLVTVTTREPSQDVLVIGASPEAILDRRPDAEFDALFEEGRFHARLVGPGLGTDPWARAAVEACVSRSGGVPLLLDADALNLLAGEPERLWAAPGPRVVTPHPGEAKRFSGEDVPSDDAGRRAFAERLARRAGAVVCLKGTGTVVSDGERTYVNRTGNAGMATAGAGDVLSGIAVAYLAHSVTCGGEDWDAFDATCTAVRVHGRAGDLAAEELGRRAVTATDLIRHLARAQREDEASAGG